jgi:branched-chain amino acid transport system substrate-binding protein
MHFLKQLLAVAAIAVSTLAGAEPGVTATTITLGMSAPFTGPNGAYGLDMRKVIEGYFDQVNKAGGVNGRKISLTALDDGYETDRTVANTNALINDKKVFALMAYYGSSPTTEAMNKVFGPARVPLVGTISGAGSLREPISQNPGSRYMFHVRASYADETEAIVNQLVSLGLKNVAVFYQNDGFGKSGLEGVTAALKKHNLAPTAAATVERNSVEVASAVDAIAKTKPQAVVMVTLYKPTAAFVTAMKAAGQRPMFMTLSPVGSEQLVKELGADARGIGISQVMPYPWNECRPDGSRLSEADRQQGRLFVLRYRGVRHGPHHGRCVAQGRQGSDPREIHGSPREPDRHGPRAGSASRSAPATGRPSRFVEMTVVGPGGKILK